MDPNNTNPAQGTMPPRPSQMPPQPQQSPQQPPMAQPTQPQAPAGAGVSSASYGQPGVSTPPQPVTSAPSQQPGQQVVGATLNQDFEPENGGGGSKMAVIAGIVVILLVVIAGSAVLYFSSGMGTPEQAIQANQEGMDGEELDADSAMRPIPIPTINPDSAFVRHSVGGVYGEDGATATVGEPVSVTLDADSQGSDVLGYDILIPYDKDSFEIQNVASLNDAFEIYPKDREEYYAVTGIKLLSVTDPTPFGGEPIIEFEIVPKQVGELYIDVMEDREKETTKFVDADVQLIRPQIQPIKITVTE